MKLCCSNADEGVGPLIPQSRCDSTIDLRVPEACAAQIVVDRLARVCYARTPASQPYLDGNSDRRNRFDYYMCGV